MHSDSIVQMAMLVDRFIPASGRVLDVGCWTNVTVEFKTDDGSPYDGPVTRENLAPETITAVSEHARAVSYRPLFEGRGWDYVGVDLDTAWLLPGPHPNVDVRGGPYTYPFADGTFDLLIAGQVLEHCEFFWLAWVEWVRVVKPGGCLIVVAPSRGPEHRFPVDCWRFYPDGFRALAKYAGNIEVLGVETDWTGEGRPEDAAMWGDTVGVFRRMS